MRFVGQLCTESRLANSCGFVICSFSVFYVMFCIQFVLQEKLEESRYNALFIEFF